jgi:hypothetical protein
MRARVEALRDEPWLAALLLFNVTLQVLDGVATWIGVGAGFPEGNPLLRRAMLAWGTGPTLCLFKLEACACLLLVWHLRRSWVAAPALAFCAVVYLTFAIGPWAALLRLGPLAS